MAEHFTWVEKYRPITVEECILPERIKNLFRGYVASNHIPHLTLSGPPGVGKTTIAIAACHDLHCEWMKINGSNEGRLIDTFRSQVQKFASSVSMYETGQKVVIIDEGDYMNAQSVMPALRGITEEYAENCSFLLTCNYVNRLIPALQSRAPVVDFTLQPDEKQPMAIAFMKRLRFILDSEKIEYEVPVLVAVIKKFFPDFRAIIGAVQNYATAGNGKIDSGLLAAIKTSNVEEVIDALKAKDFSACRQWVAENAQMDMSVIYHDLYQKLYPLLDGNSKVNMIVTVAKYQYQSAFVADQEINLAACLAEIIVDCVFV